MLLKKNTAVTVTFEIKRNLSQNIEMSTYFKVGALSLQLECFDKNQIDHISCLTETPFNLRFLSQPFQVTIAISLIIMVAVIFYRTVTVN